MVSLPGIEESIRRWELSATNASDALRHCTSTTERNLFSPSSTSSSLHPVELLHFESGTRAIVEPPPPSRTSFHRSNISFDLVASSSIDDEDTWTDILGYSVNCSVSCRCNSGERNTSVRNTNARTGDENWYAAGNGLKRTPH